MKLINRLEELFNKVMRRDDLSKTGTIKEILTGLIGKDEAEAHYHEEVYLLLKAMINAAKSDGTIDADEQKKIMEFMGDMSKIEQMFVEQEMSQPLQLDSFLKEIPEGMEIQEALFRFGRYQVLLDDRTYQTQCLFREPSI